ncbi:calcium-binding protein [Streptomyces sp. NPDC098781]|uniref:calcium-binding protein n=1 Tax=Streptomyces sp. NPDC098781 TaxID=3366097 RepID=UPI003827A9AB
MSFRLSGHRALRAAAVLTLALGTALALPMVLTATRDSPGPPATAEVKFETLHYTAAPGQNNRVTVDASTVGFTYAYVIDDVVAIVPGTGCAYPSTADHTKVSCQVQINDMATDPIRTLLLQLGDGEDTATGGHIVGNFNMGYTEINLGSGNDTWNGTGREAGRVYGGPGDDTITGSGQVMIEGGADDDTLHSGGDVLGGSGDDVIQGEGGADFQTLSGQRGDDTIHGGPGDDVLFGNEGNDVLYGDDGDDRIWGETGNGYELSRDEKLGRKRDDKLYGGPGTDELYGGPGPDELYGGPGTDKLDGGTSPNTVVQD